jgi:hypothetical protein
MSTANSPPPQPNSLGKASLVLGILSSFFVFSIGLCAGVGKQQGWLSAVGTLLFLLGGSFTFLGLLGVLLGFGGLFGRNRSRATALIGLLLGLIAVGMFLAILGAVQ